MPSTGYLRYADRRVQGIRDMQDSGKLNFGPFALILGMILLLWAILGKLGIINCILLRML